MSSQGDSESGVSGLDVSGQPVKGGARLPAVQMDPIDVSDIVNAETLEEAIAVALSAASVQWAGGTNGVFLEDGVMTIAEALMERVKKGDG